MPFVDIDSLDETRSCFCFDIFHFQNSSPPSSFLGCCLNFLSSNNSHDTSNKEPPTSHPMQCLHQSASLKLTSNDTSNKAPSSNSPPMMPPMTPPILPLTNLRQLRSNKVPSMTPPMMPSTTPSTIPSTTVPPTMALTSNGLQTMVPLTIALSSNVPQTMVPPTTLPPQQNLRSGVSNHSTSNNLCFLGCFVYFV